MLRIETPPVGELSNGVPAPADPREAERAELLAGVRRANGKIADAKSAGLLGVLGGRAKAAKAKLLADTPAILKKLGLKGTPETLAPYIPDGQAFADVETARLARVIGGGVCEGAAASFVQSAALQLAGSRAAFAAGDLVTGSRLANDSRQNLLAAHELCAREAEARERNRPSPFFARFGAGQQAPAPWMPSSASPAEQSAPAGQPAPAASEHVGAAGGVNSSNLPPAAADLDHEPDEEPNP